MATHFNILAWEIPQTEDPGGLHTAHVVINVGHQGVGPVEEGPPGGRRVSQRGKVKDKAVQGGRGDVR